MITTKTLSKNQKNNQMKHQLCESQINQCHASNNRRTEPSTTKHQTHLTKYTRMKRPKVGSKNVSCHVPGIMLHLTTVSPLKSPSPDQGCHGIPGRGRGCLWLSHRASSSHRSQGEWREAPTAHPHRSKGELRCITITIVISVAIAICITSATCQGVWPQPPRSQVDWHQGPTAHRVNGIVIAIAFALPSPLALPLPQEWALPL